MDLPYEDIRGTAEGNLNLRSLKAEPMGELFHNLMWDRTRAEGSVAILQIGDEMRIDAPTAFAIALGGSATVAIDDEEHVLGEQDALQVDDGGTLVVIDGEVYLATIT